MNITRLFSSWIYVVFPYSAVVKCSRVEDWGSNITILFAHRREFYYGMSRLQNQEWAESSDCRISTKKKAWNPHLFLYVCSGFVFVDTSLTRSGKIEHRVDRIKIKFYFICCRSTAIMSAFPPLLKLPLAIWTIISTRLFSMIW